MVVSALIISGGLGFIVWRDLLEYHQKEDDDSFKNRINRYRYPFIRRFCCVLFHRTQWGNVSGRDMFQRLANTFL